MFPKFGQQCAESATFKGDRIEEKRFSRF